MNTCAKVLMIIVIVAMFALAILKIIAYQNRSTQRKKVKESGVRKI